MIYEIPDAEPLDLRTIILDLNGTLSVSGVVPDGVQERITKLKQRGFEIILFTGNTRGNANELAQSLGIEWRLAANGAEKRDLALKMNPEYCVSIGNGLIDLELMKVVKFRMVTIQAESVHVQTLLNSDVIVPTIINALDMLLDPNILIATIRP